MHDEQSEADLSKHVAAKVRRAAEARMPTRRRGVGDPRLPPGQNPVTDLPLLDLGIRPEIAWGDWRLEVGGLVRAPIELDWDALSRMPQTEVVADIHCVNGWSRLGSRFGGVALRDLLAAAGPLDGARFAMLRSSDGYSSNLSLDDLASEGALLAHSLDGEPLPAEHGGPVRLVVPRLYFWKSAKWLVRVELLAEDEPGFWEERGYHRRGDPWAEQRYAAQDGSFYPRRDRELPVHLRADADGAVALAELEALQARLGGGGGAARRPLWRRILGL